MDLISLAKARLSAHLNPKLRFSRRSLISRSHRLIPLPMRLLRFFTNSSNFSRNSSSSSSRRSRCRSNRALARSQALRFLVHQVGNDDLRDKVAWMLNRLSLVAWLGAG